MTNSPHRQPAVPSLAIVVLIDIPASVLGALWGRYGVNVGVAAITPSILILVLVISRLFMVRAPFYPDRKRPWSGLDRLVEQSMFGVGSVDDWTASNPDATYSDLRGTEEPITVASNSGRLVSEHSVDESVNGGRPIVKPAVPRVSPHQPVSDAAVAARGSQPAVEEYSVKRGDTYWSLAERAFGDGSRWPEVQQLNIGRAVASDVVLEEGGSLSPGWTIVIPVAAE